jgi:hypothetical protein
MPRSPLFALGSLLLATAQLLAVEPVIPSQEAVLDGLRTEHPRLLATAPDFQQLKDRCAENDAARQWFARLKSESEKLLSTPPLEYKIPDGKRLLAVSRAAKDRVLLLGLVYRLTSDQRFAIRLWQELDTVTHFKDWNPSHFLDTAEMTFAVAIGYDWLYDVWSPEQRQQLRQAIVHLGLEQGLPIYRKQTWWAKANHNWNQVCNGGMAVGALAIAEDEPQIAREILHSALVSIPRAMHEFGPDGGWGEGPGYWRYATEYNVYLLAALKTAFGRDFDLSKIAGFSETGDFPLYFTGPTGQTFNYADAHGSWHGAPQLFWLATEFSRPAWAFEQQPQAADRPSPLDLLWGAPWISRKNPPNSLPLDRHFEGVSVAFLRGAWNDKQATFVGFKGGDNRVNHGHLDLGSFVLDMLGERWFVDLGSDDYNLPGYFGSHRWDFYRLRAEGHNTLVLNPDTAPDQDPRATANITHCKSTPDRASAIADLTAAYAADATSVRRGVALLDRRDMLIQDELHVEHGGEVWWFAHTPANVTLDASSRVAKLEQNGKTVYATLCEPADARFSVLDASPLPTSPRVAGQADESHGSHPIRKLAIHLEKQTAVRVAVLISPTKPTTVAIKPLDQW